MAKRLYVGNLPYESTEEEVSEAFGEFGEVTKVNLIKDRETGKAKGFGFIDIETEADVSEMVDIKLNGRTLKVDNAREKQKR